MYALRLRSRDATPTIVSEARTGLHSSASGNRPFTLNPMLVSEMTSIYLATKRNRGEFNERSARHDGTRCAVFDASFLRRPGE